MAASQDSRLFYELFADTARRDGFAIRSHAYFADLIETLAANQLGELLVAYHGKVPLAGAVISYYDGLASYLYGASASRDRELMAPYLLHWTAMQHAKARNCHTYDLLTIAPFRSEQQTVNSKQSDGSSSFVPGHSHKYAGITRFKQQFGGRPVHLLGSWDLPVRPFTYAAFRFAETWRRR